MPGFEGACEFPSARDHLPELPLHDWHGHLFTAIHAHESIDALLAPIDERLPWLDIAGLRPDPARARSFEFDAHWALYVENYLEGLHIPFLHPGLNAALDIGSYRYELFERGNLQLALARDGELAFEPPVGSPEHGQRIAAYYFWLWPNLMLNFYPWGLSVNLVLPLSPARTRVIFRSFVGDESRLVGGTGTGPGAGAGGALDPVEMEDEAAVIAVQRGYPFAPVPWRALFAGARAWRASVSSAARGGGLTCRYLPAYDVATHERNGWTLTRFSRHWVTRHAESCSTCCARATGKR